MARKTIRAGTSTGPTIRKDSYAFVHQEDLNRLSLVNKFYVDTAISSLSQDISSTYATQQSVANSLATKPSFTNLTNSLADIVGWSGKNLMPNNAVTTTTNGVTFTANSDGTITVNGTANPTALLAIPKPLENLELDTDYILTGCPKFGSYETFALQCNYVLEDGSQAGAFDYGSGITFKTASKTDKIGGNPPCYIFVRTGVTVSNLVFKPMIRRADDPDSTYVPYHPSVANSLATKQTNIYSTTETAIGTWRDNTTIYRKSVTGSITTYSTEGTSRAFYASDLASDASTIVNIGGTYIRNSGHKNPINVPFVSTSGLSITGIPNIYINSSGKVKLVFFGDESTTRIDFDIYIDYTKTN